MKSVPMLIGLSRLGGGVFGKAKQSKPRRTPAAPAMVNFQAGNHPQTSNHQPSDNPTNGSPNSEAGNSFRSLDVGECHRIAQTERGHVTKHVCQNDVAQVSPCLFAISEGPAKSKAPPTRCRIPIVFSQLKKPVRNQSKKSGAMMAAFGTAP